MKKQATFTLCGKTYQAPMQICGFFAPEDERYEVILPYLKEGLENNDEVLNILESTSYDDHCGRLSNAGIDVVNGKIHKNPHDIEPMKFLPILIKRKMRFYRKQAANSSQTT